MEATMTTKPAAGQQTSPHNRDWLASLSSDELSECLMEAQQQGMRATYDADAQRCWARAAMYKAEMERREAAGLAQALRLELAATPAPPQTN